MTAKGNIAPTHNCGIRYRNHKLIPFPLLYLCFILLLFCVGQVQAQPNNNIRLYHITSAHTSFPDTGRLTGYWYDRVHYDAATHYQDSTILIIVPKHLKVHKTITLLFWFHGWRNNVDSAAVRYGLIRQFEQSHRNAVLILSETAKDAPDSYGGKLEQPGQFESLVNDILLALKNKHVIPRDCKAGSILVAGHSGAYRVIASILNVGHLPVLEVILFDALYGETAIFKRWMEADSTRRFINWYTDYGGGTKEVTMELIQELQNENKSPCAVEEVDLTTLQLKQCPLLFVHSSRQHNDIINQSDNFLHVLQNSSYIVKMKQ